ncbi:MAG: hypothetical protein K0S29_1418 [Gammaproteobacteria bacterium]|jgi:hypothetical protein|nr:hypothetical protein [Gammaproteobacteria bacterium]
MLKLTRTFIAGFTVNFLLAHLSFAAPIIIADGNSNIDYSGWANYATSLDTCSPNTFNLPDPFEISMLQAELETTQNQKAPSQTIQAIGNAIAHAVISYTIYGFNQENKCLVNISRTFNPPPGAPSSMQPITVNMNCSFSASDLATLAQNAQQIASGKQDTAGQSPSSQIMTQSCSAAQTSSS